jgi:hypothetical protein
MTINSRADIERSLEQVTGHLYHVQDLCRLRGATPAFTAEWGHVFDSVQRLLVHARRLPVTDTRPDPSPKPPTYTGD